MNTSPQFDKQDLRRALGTFGTGVTVVTTKANNSTAIGVTANSFSSVSLEPPIILWSLLKTSPSLYAFDECGYFAINVLALNQVDLSKQFSSRLPNKFEGVQFSSGLKGLPILSGCASVFQCRTIQRLEVGDHILFLGQIEEYQHNTVETLLFCAGQYAQRAALSLATAPTN
jgi:flavin reductase (DIM6/NTAB) family NADH-FMN oxidoreductase RutF